MLLLLLLLLFQGELREEFGEDALLVFLGWEFLGEFLDEEIAGDACEGDVGEGEPVVCLQSFEIRVH